MELLTGECPCLAPTGLARFILPRTKIGLKGILKPSNCWHRREGGLSCPSAAAQAGDTDRHTQKEGENARRQSALNSGMKVSELNGTYQTLQGKSKV